MDKLKVLVVYDEADIREVIIDLLDDEYNLEFFEAENGLVAFEKCKSTKFNLIVSDHHMPMMTGSQFCEAITKRENLNSETPVVYISGYIDTLQKEFLQLSQEIIYIEKPISPEQLFSIIDPFVGLAKK